MEHYRTVQTCVPSLPALTYTLPDHIAPHEAVVGAFVSVPVGRRQVSGVITSETHHRPKDVKYIKAIADIADIPAVHPSFIRFMHMLADYYLADTGRAFDLCLPPVRYFFADMVSTPYVTLTRDAVSDPEGLTEKRRKLLDVIKDNGGSMAKAESLQQAGCGASVLRALEASGYVRSFIHDAPSEHIPPPLHVESAPQLNDTQRHALQAILEDRNRFGVSLLQGVTGSGKTEVFFAAAEAVLRDDPNAQILFLMPEIALTRQMRDRTAERFGSDPLLRHAQASESAKKKAFRAAASGAPCIVLGARSALFLPYRNLKLIVLDEEHDSAYKQQEGVCYHARDMAVIRAKLASCPLVLASATPSLESLHNTDTGKYRKVMLPSRFGVATMPDTRLIDLKKTPAARGNSISPPLAEHVERTLARGGQALLFLNKRGYAPLTLCRACGYVEECSACSARMVFHQARKQLLCHYCGQSRAPATVCPSCLSEEERVMCGPGAEKLYEEAQVQFPDARVALLTGDTAAKEAESILTDLTAGSIDILVGTQIVSKGLHFPGLQLVGMVDADMALYGSDPRAAERAWQLIRQTSGRAGRGAVQGTVMIQTHSPDHPLYRLLAGNDADSFPNIELKLREESMMPPFTKLACVRFSAPYEQLASAHASQMADLLRRASVTLPDKEQEIFGIFGPAPPPVAKRAHIYYSRLVVRARTHVSLAYVLRHALSRYTAEKHVALHLDIDPINSL